MTEGEALDPWTAASLAGALTAVDPAGLGGLSLRAGAGPVRETWLAQFRSLLPAECPVRRLPPYTADDRLVGGLDLAATLRAGKPVAAQGILSEAHGGIVLLPMAERLPPASAARIAMAMDTGSVSVERDGLGLVLPARFGIIALDESLEDEDAPPPALTERLAFRIDLRATGIRDMGDALYTADEIGKARALRADVTISDAVREALCSTALALGIGSLRAPLLAQRAACAAAALDGVEQATDDHAALAARLVLAHRATVLPALEDDTEEEPPEPPDDPPDDPSQDDPGEEQDLSDKPLEDKVLEAAQAFIPEGLLDRLKLAAGPRNSSAGGGAGQLQASKLRGRPIGTRRGLPRSGARLDVVETLRAAAPWQALRRGQREQSARVEVRRDDFRVKRFKRRNETTAIFVVDASGSAAVQRLAEAKGAVEYLLADCYVRRDQVALIAFRGQEAELLLPPTRSLTRAKRSLGALPGGGGTPLATGLNAALQLADSIKRRGQTPLIIVLTDGQANIARDGTPGRAQAGEDALAAARAVLAEGLTGLVIDTSPRPRPQAAEIAAAMGARYLPLPPGQPSGVSEAVQAVMRAS